mmetsp:Transcript_79861/g.156187  ORF Transcript_79861/g.156187 Transcript_79861/m.156187 type:complete len:283 (-) Transcript_79861:117-965(-)
MLLGTSMWLHRVKHSVFKWVSVNGGVFAVAWTTKVLEESVETLTSNSFVASIAATAVLYCLVFSACLLNLQGRSRNIKSPHDQQRPVFLASLIWHPIGSIFERYMHRISDDSRDSITNWDTWWCVGFVGRLLLFELAFDFVFYWTHRAVHHPSIYNSVHKQHHAHTSDVSLISSLQMGPLDVLLTHSTPVLLALQAVPFSHGLEFCLVKTYLLFQELYGHAGVSHKGRNFGPLPWLPTALHLDLRSEDHQHHHVNARVNFSKRFNLFDQLFGTWSPAKPSSL